VGRGPHVGVEPRVIEPRAQVDRIAGAAHVHARHVPALLEREQARRDGVARGVRSSQPVHDQQGRPILAPARLPGHAQQQAHFAARVHHHALGRQLEREVPAVPEAEQRLAMASARSRQGPEGGCIRVRTIACQRRRQGGHGVRTIFPKCCEASIIS
jgi:hypothetical protein